MHLRIGTLIVTLAALLPVGDLFAQRTFPLNEAPRPYAFGMEPSYHGSVDLADYDGDGDLDVLITGRSGEFFFTKVYCQSRRVLATTIGETVRYDTIRVFLEPTTNLADVWQGAAKWGDYDGDGDADVLVSGRTTLSGSDNIAPITRLYEFRNGQFVEDTRSDFVDVFAGDIAWGDYDGDSDLDVVVIGATGTAPPYVPATRLYRNDGGLFSVVPTNLPDVSLGAVAWSDVDGDGDLDLALQGVTESGMIVTDIFRNDGNGSFVRLHIDIPQVSQGSFDWGDVDGDGDEDLLVTGGMLDPHLQRGLTVILENDGGDFRRSPAVLPGVATGAGRFSDFDLDGRVDVVLSGAQTIFAQPSLFIYLNNGDGFDNALAPFGLMLGDIAVGDYNDDGDPDFVVTGRTSLNSPETLFYQNHTRRDLNAEDFEGAAVVPDILGNWSGCVQR